MVTERSVTVLVCKKRYINLENLWAHTLASRELSRHSCIYVANRMIKLAGSCCVVLYLLLGVLSQVFPRSSSTSTMAPFASVYERQNIVIHLLPSNTWLVQYCGPRACQGRQFLTRAK